MAVPYHRLIVGVGLRLNSLAGSSASALETVYVKTTQVAADYESVEVNFSAVKDLVIQAEARYSWIIASVKDENGRGNHPWRNLLHAVTASIANGGAIPPTSTGGTDKIIGVYGSVRDATAGTPLEERPLNLVRRWKRETWRTRDRFEYAIDGTRLYHTRTSATIDVCVYNSATQRAAMDASQATSMVLADSLEEALICEAVSMAFYDEAFPAQASQYRAYSNDQIAMIQACGTNAPQRITA
jgi:hypothetical protein